MSDAVSLDDYQRAATRTVNPALSDKQRLLDAAAGLAEEAGEVLGLVRKHVMQQRALDRATVVEELGDALWCLAIVADTLGVTLSDVARANEAKLRDRHPDGFSAGT
ncbi:MAG: nucleoside triphosphate pyrophosphohydrolase family protein [Polaromonas sp.]|nr:nucleoside triphosphate pyrophosphohydrolase family protein [Gemmatimonadaceae bacterium]